MSFCLDDGAELLYGPGSLSGGGNDEPRTAIFHSTIDPSEAATRAHHTSAEAVGLLSGVPGFTKPIGFYKRLIFAPLALGVLVLGGLFGYRYFTNAKQFGSIAVMPFVNASGSADLEYLSDGMTESLMNSLSQLPNVSVKARSTVFRYKGQEIEPATVGKELGVQVILNGRLMQRGDQVSVSLDLVDAATGDQLWGDQYSRKVSDIAALQTQISRDVASNLRQKLTGEQETNVTKNQTQNSEAYQLYLQGRYLWNKREAGANRKAIEFFQKAIDKDPSYAMAYVGLAECYITGFLSVKERKPLVEGAANKALAIDPTLGEPHAVLGVIRTSDAKYDEGEAEFKRAIELSPNYASAYHWYGEALAVTGRFDESFAQYEKALELDPLSLAIGTDLGRAYYLSRDYDRASEYLNKLIEIDPNYVRTHFYLVSVYQEMGKLDEGLSEIEKALLLSGEDRPRFEKDVRMVREALKTSGPAGYWNTIYELQRRDFQAGETDLIPMARICARAGKRDEAFEYLDRAIREDGEGVYSAFKVSPEWDNLRDDPRFADLLKRVGF